jgi:hypothetical protein
VRELVRGWVYDRAEIHGMFGGSMQADLPMKDGRVLMRLLPPRSGSGTLLPRSCSAQAKRADLFSGDADTAGRDPLLCQGRAACLAVCGTLASDASG